MKETYTLKNHDGRILQAKITSVMKVDLHYTQAVARGLRPYIIRDSDGKLMNLSVNTRGGALCARVSEAA